MRICVVGCGAVGSLFAANLAQLDGVEVWAFDVSQPHVDAIERERPAISGAGDVLGRLRATTDPAELPPCDFGIVATKAMHTGAAVAAASGALADGAVASVRTGSATRETIAEHVPRVIRGTTFPAGKILGPRSRAVGCQGRNGARAVRAAAGLARRGRAACRTHARGAGLPTQAVADARGPQWRKVIFNSGDQPGRGADRPDARAGLR